MITVPSTAGPRPALDLSTYLVTDTAQCAELGVVQTVHDAVIAGVTLVQVRDPAANDRELIDLTRAVVATVTSLGEQTGRRVPVLLNDRVDLVATTGADGAHVGQSDLGVLDARRLLGPEPYLGLSVHSHEELAAAVEIKQIAGEDPLDYLGIGPLRATSSKLDHEPARGLPHLAALAAASTWPCVAIGGVTADDALDLRGAGLAGMAVISAICGQPDVQAATEILVTAWTSGTRAQPKVTPS